MSVYVVKGDEGIYLSMEADSVSDTPTVIEGGEALYPGQFEYAEEMRKAGLSVQQIASRMGPYASVEEEIVPDEVGLSKAAYRVTTIEHNGYVATVLVDDDGVLVGYLDESPPLGFEEGKRLSDWLEQQRGYKVEQVIEPKHEDPEDHTDDKTMSDAAKVGEAVGAALMASGVISKADKAQQIVYGWAYVTHDKDGRINFDKSGEFVDDIEEIEKAAVSFMIKHRATDRHHTNIKSGEVVESMVFTKEKIEKMGLDPNAIPLGWWIGTKVDDETWAEYEAGRLTSFSVHGRGTRSKVDPDLAGS